MPISITMLTLSFFGFIMIPNTVGVSRKVPSTASNVHLNKVTNGQWHSWIAGDSTQH